MSLTADLVNPSAVPGLTRRVGVAAVAGVAGGIVMGMPMAMMGMLPMIGGLVGSDSAVTGGIVHMVISAIIGAIYGLAIGGPAATYANGWWMGLAYGVIWWVLGPLLIMPGMMGMGPQFGMALSGPMLLSLVAHMMYGVVTGLAYPFLLARAR